MGKILTTAQAGTLESSDIMVTVAPVADGSGIIIELESIVMAQYGQVIRQTLAKVVADHGIHDVHIKAVDRGALDCTIKARTMAALGRAGAVLKGEIL